jgi:hypothetical protein
MENITDQIKDLETQLDEVRQQIKTKGEELSQAEGTLKEKEEALKNAEFQEILETVEDKLVPLYQKEKESINQISSSMNKLFKRTARAVEKINLMLKDLSELKKEIKNAENKIAQNAQQDGSGVREAIELNRVKVDQDFEGINQVNGASFLVKQVNMAMGNSGGAYEALLKDDFSYLPDYALNIYDSVKGAGAKSLRTKMEDLIRISKIPEPRIILAREMVLKFLDKLKENNLIEYSLEGDAYLITDSKA